SSPAALPLCFMVLTVFVWFQTTFDFMTEGVLPKELRIFALSLTPSAAIHLALLLRQGNLTSLSLRSIPLISIYGISVVLGILNSATFFPISVAYALLKYSHFDLGRVLKVALSRVALITLLVVIYAIIAFVVAPWAGSYAKDPLVPIFFSVFVVAVFNPLLRWLENVVD